MILHSWKSLFNLDELLGNISTKKASREITIIRISPHLDLDCLFQKLLSCFPSQVTPFPIPGCSTLGVLPARVPLLHLLVCKLIRGSLKSTYESSFPPILSFINSHSRRSVPCSLNNSLSQSLLPNLKPATKTICCNLWPAQLWFLGLLASNVLELSGSSGFD